MPVVRLLLWMIYCNHFIVITFTSGCYVYQLYRSLRKKTGVSIARGSIATNVLVWYGRGLCGCCTQFQCQGEANLSSENTRSTLGVLVWRACSYVTVRVVRGSWRVWVRNSLVWSGIVCIVAFVPETQGLLRDICEHSLVLFLVFMWPEILSCCRYFYERI